MLMGLFIYVLKSGTSVLPLFYFKPLDNIAWQNDFANNIYSVLIYWGLGTSVIFDNHFKTAKNLRGCFSRHY